MLHHRYLIFTVLTLTTLVYAMQFTTIAVALPDVIEDLNAPLNWSGWILTLFMIGQVIALPLGGRLAQQIGQRTLFALGLAGFTAASLAAALAPNVELLIAARAVQGLTGGVMQPATIGLISDAFGEQRARPIGLTTAVGPIGTVIGPTVGGLLVEHVSWRATFAINAPLGLLALAAALAILPHDAGRQARRQRFDFAGLALLTVAITSLIYALTELGRRTSDPNPQLVGAGVALAVVAAAGFMLQERRAAEPIVEVDLLRRPEFAYANTLGFCYGAALFGIANFMPTYAQFAYDMSASVAGEIVTPRAVMVVLSSAVVALVLPRTGYRVLLLFGLIGLAVMLGALSQGQHTPEVLGVRLSDFAWLAIVSAGSGLFIGTINPALNNASLHLAPERIPAIVGMRGMFQFLGGTIGTALIVLVMARAGSRGGGLELAFAGLALLMLLTALLVPRIPDLPRRGRPLTVEPAQVQQPIPTAHAEVSKH